MAQNLKKYPVLIALLIFSTVCKKIFIQYGVSNQGWQLYKFLYDVKDGFYIDIGAYDPIYASNTLNLYTQGWGGINIDANPQRLNRFFLMRPDQTNLNYAIGQQNKYVTLYQLDEDSSSTVSYKVKQFVKQYKKVVEQVKIPSLSLKQICQTYYYIKPTFMNLDIQGYGSKALQLNNWQNQKCVPNLILSQAIQQNTQSGFILPAELLAKYGYKRFKKTIGLNQLFIHQSVYASYMQKYNAMESKSDQFGRVGLYNVVNPLIAYLKSSTQFFKHYQPTTDNIYYKFTKINQILDLNKLNDQSNRLSNHVKTNRIIIILHFNLNNNAIVIRQGTWSIKEIVVEGYKFYQIVANKSQQSGRDWIKDSKGGSKSFKVYILDHQFGGNILGLQPKIIDAVKKSYQLQNIKQYTPQVSNTTQIIKNAKQQSQKQLQIISKATFLISKDLKNQTQLLSRLYSGQVNQSQHIKNSFLGYHNTQFSILQQISTIVNNYYKIMSIFTQKSQKDVIKQNKRVNKVKEQLTNLQNIQHIIIVCILIMLLSLCLSSYIITRRNKINRIQKQRSN